MTARGAGSRPTVQHFPVWGPQVACRAMPGTLHPRWPKAIAGGGGSEAESAHLRQWFAWLAWFAWFVGHAAAVLVERRICPPCGSL
jgi:hypothetical protein